MSYDENLITSDLVIDNVAIGHLKESATWGKFLGVMGFIFSNIIAVIGIAAGFSISRLGSSYSGRRLRLAEGGGVTLLYLAGAVILFFMSLYLFRFAQKIKTAIATGNLENITEACKNLKLYFRFAGIISIISVVLTILSVIGMVMAASYSRY